MPPPNPSMSVRNAVKSRAYGAQKQRAAVSQTRRPHASPTSTRAPTSASTTGIACRPQGEENQQYGREAGRRLLGGKAQRQQGGRDVEVVWLLVIDVAPDRDDDPQREYGCVDVFAREAAVIQQRRREGDQRRRRQRSQPAEPASEQQRQQHQDAAEQRRQDACRGI